MGHDRKVWVEDAWWTNCGLTR